MTKSATLEELVDKYLKGKSPLSSAESYDEYKHKRGMLYGNDYSDAAGAIYAEAKKGLSTYGANSRKIHNKGLQNSGYASYIDKMSENKFAKDLSSLKDLYKKNETEAKLSYASYLDSYRDKQNSLKRSVMSHLVGNDVTDINTAVAYGMSAGLSEEDALEIGKGAYEVTKKKIFDKLIEQTVSLGLDKDGARKLAINMGISEEDANGFAEQIGELLEHYKSLSSDYLDFLESRAD